MFLWYDGQEHLTYLLISWTFFIHTRFLFSWTCILCCLKTAVVIWKGLVVLPFFGLHLFFIVSFKASHSPWRRIFVWQWTVRFWTMVCGLFLFPHDTNKRNSFVWKYLYRRTAEPRPPSYIPHLCVDLKLTLSHKVSVGPNVAVSLQPGSASGLVECCQNNSMSSLCLVFHESVLQVW